MEFIDINMIQLLGVVVLVFCGGYYVGTRNTEIKWLHRQITKLELQTTEIGVVKSINSNGNGYIKKNYDVKESETLTVVDSPSI